MLLDLSSLPDSKVHGASMGLNFSEGNPPEWKQDIPGRLDVTWCALRCYIGSTRWQLPVVKPLQWHHMRSGRPKSTATRLFVLLLTQADDKEHIQAHFTGPSLWVWGAPDSKVHGAILRPIWGRQDPDGPHVGPMNFAVWAGVRVDIVPRP